MSHERLSRTDPDVLAGFQRAYSAALEAVKDVEQEPAGDDLTRLREQLLHKPPDEPAELSRTRQALLDDPEKLKQFFGVFSRHDAALRHIETDGSLTLL